jgi:hypothetical protein
MPAIAKKLLTDSSLTQCTIYFKYYLHQALIKAGLGNDYMNWLDVWRNNIKMGMTTWGEVSDLQNTRSDCHAWGASPNIEFFRTVLGVDSYAPGFAKIKIEPHLGTLTNVSGEIPHPNGKVSVSYNLVGKSVKSGSTKVAATKASVKNNLNYGKWQINISLPEKTSGILVWKTKIYVLKAGTNSFSI